MVLIYFQEALPTARALQFVDILDPPSYPCRSCCEFGGLFAAGDLGMLMSGLV